MEAYKKELEEYNNTLAAKAVEWCSKSLFEHF